MAGLGQTVRDLWRLLSLPERISDKEAQERGIQFLTQNLSPTQRQQYKRHGYFDVVGGCTGTRYRIWQGCQLNVEQLDGSARRVRLCFVPRGGLPVGDIMLAQKIALELFESEAISVANGSWVWDNLFENEMPLRHRVHRY